VKHFYLVPAFLLGGCMADPALHARNAPIGQDFDVGALSRLEIGTTTLEEAEALFGQPSKQSSLKGIVNATSKDVPPGTPYTLTEVRYEYAPYGPGFPPQAHPFKRAVLAFQDNVLAAYSLNDTIDPTAAAPINDSLLAELHQCRTTSAEALALLGPPGGFNLTVPRLHPGPSGLTYQSLSSVNGARVAQSLKLSFDKSGRLTNYLLADNATLSGPGKDTAPPACPS
jgi:hypothetical protein